MWRRKKKQEAEELATYEELFGVEPPKEMKEKSWLRILAPLLIAQGIKWAIIHAMAKQVTKQLEAKR